MTFSVKCTILVCCLVLCEFVLGTHNKENSILDPRRSPEWDEITNALSDDEIRMALSDLTLSDLSALSELVDGSNDVQYTDAADRDHASGKNQPFRYELESDGGENVYFDDGKQQAVTSAGFAVPRETFEALFSENARAKREDSQKEGNTVDEEYLKLLENSFPQVSDQNEMHEEVSEIKKSHIRVKRE